MLPRLAHSALSCSCVTMHEMKWKGAFCARLMAAGELEVAGCSGSQAQCVTVAISCRVTKPGIMLPLPARAG